MILWWHQGTSGAIRRYFSDTSVPVKQSRDTVVTLGIPSGATMRYCNDTRVPEELSGDTVVALRYQWCLLETL